MPNDLPPTPTQARQGGNRQDMDAGAVLSAKERLMNLANPPRNNIGTVPAPGQTRRLVACGDMLDLRVLDHMILGRGLYSMAEHGELR